MRYKVFDKVTIDRSEIPQSMLNIDIKIKNNNFTWNGQFSPQLIDILLEKYTKSNDKVLDPFVGSGTTILESSLIGLDVCGIELNPAAFNFSFIYTLCNCDEGKRRKIIDTIENNYLSKDLTKILELKSDFHIKNIIIVLVMINKGLDYSTLYSNWEKLKELIFSLPYSNNNIEIFNSDARKIELKENYYNILITSPPYINVLNYHQQYRKEMELLGFNILEIAPSEIGSNRKNRTNRFNTVVQYCIDITFLIKNILFSMTTDSRLIFVIGRSSKVLGISFSNSRLLYEILVRIFKCPNILRQERYFKNKYGKIIYEDILHFSCNKKYINKNEDYYISYARKIASQYITEKLEKLDKDHIRYELLNNTISNINEINQSK